MRFSRQNNWNELSCPLPGGLPDPGVEPRSLTYLALAGRFLPLEPPGKLLYKVFIWDSLLWSWCLVELDALAIKACQSVAFKKEKEKKKPNIRAYITSLEWCSEKRYWSTLLRPESFLARLSVFNFCLYFWENHFNCEFTVFALNGYMIKQDCCLFFPQCLEW